MSLESQLNRNYRRPEQAKAPLRRNQASRPQRQFVSAPERPKAPLRTNQQKSRPVVRPTRTTFNSRRQQAARNELFQRRLLALSMLDPGPAPSPDRTTGRELAGFSSAAFTKPWRELMNQKNNGFTPSPSGGKLVGYGTQAGNPKQQAEARQMQMDRGPVNALAKALGASPVGEVAGDIQANRTWAKLAPLFGRNPKKPPPTAFTNTGGSTVGLEHAGTVELDRSLLNDVLRGGKGVVETAAHEYAHTQQQGQGSGSRGQVEGGARAFEDAVSSLLGYKPKHPGGARDKYGQWAWRNFTKPGTMSALNPGGSDRSPDLRKILIDQFPHAYTRRTPVLAQRRNLAQ